MMIDEANYMNLIEKLCKANEESEIEEISAYIADDVRSEMYSLKQINEILCIYSTFDLLSMNYKTREQILYTISEIANIYRPREIVDLKKIFEIRDLLEDDLKEYVDEIINVYHN